jgi:very-short-patch-repair endonuclease
MARDQAKALRANMTDAERQLWYRLRAHRFQSFKFKRQVPIGRYIVDFVCLERCLVIEVDGGQHADSKPDETRDQWLRQQGFRVLRFWNNEVFNNTDGVLEVIVEHLGHSAPAPSPGTPLRVAPPSPTCAASLLGGEGKKDRA